MLFRSCGVFDSKTFVATKAKEQGIFRSTDTGATWTRMDEQSPVGAVPVVINGTGYWAAGKTILVSKDNGATWTPLGADLDAVLGPYFGKSESHFMVVGKKGFQETKDGGKTWQVAAPLPAGFGVGRVGPNYAWDPNADILYASSMGKPTFKYQR